MIVICSLISVRMECLHLSDNRGPYNTIDQCLDRNKRIYTDSLKVLPEYKLADADCRIESGKIVVTRKYPKSSIEI